jgi:hypothetical protein
MLSGIEKSKIGDDVKNRRENDSKVHEEADDIDGKLAVLCGRDQSAESERQQSVFEKI